jgi:hypothetical protein
MTRLTKRHQPASPPRRLTAHHIGWLGGGAGGQARGRSAAIEAPAEMSI